MKNYLLISSMLIFLMTACKMNSSVQPSAPVDIRCGDGVCAEPENASLCPADCAKASVPVDGSGPVLSYGIMVHLEGWDDGREKGSFERHAEAVRRYASLFESFWRPIDAGEQGIHRWVHPVGR